MVRDDWPPSPSWLPRISLEILKFRFSVHMVKVKDDGPPAPWLPRILPEILKFRFSVHMVKDDWPPCPLTAQDFTRNFESLDLVCTWLKMIDPPAPWLPRILPEILKFRFSVHMVKDDWPPCPLTGQDFTRNFKV